MSNFVTSDEIPILLEKKILVASRTLTLITTGSRLLYFCSSARSPA